MADSRDPDQELSIASTSAGPSKSPKPRKQKKRPAKDAVDPTPDPASKNPRLISPEQGDDDVDITRGDNETLDPMERLASGAGDPMEDLEQDMRENGDGGDGAGKMPLRADEFEQKAEREVEASKGLDGGAAGDEGKMKLVHQVGSQFLQDGLMLINLGPTSGMPSQPVQRGADIDRDRSPCLLATHMLPLRGTSGSTRLLGHTNSSSTLSNTSRPRVSRGTRVSWSQRIPLRERQS